MIFNKAGKNINHIKFHIGDDEIESVKEMKYLGIEFNNNGTFNTAIDNLKSKGIKALFKLFKSFGNFLKALKLQPILLMP